MTAIIRLARESDAADVLEIYRPIACDTAISFELKPPTIEEMREGYRVRAYARRVLA